MAMTSKNELRVGIKFETDNKQLQASKQQLNELLVSLKEVEGVYNSSNKTDKHYEGLKKATEQAKKLEQILNSS